MPLHHHVSAAASGELPSWAVVGESRFAHVQRVSGLLGEWSSSLDLGEVAQQRWRAVGLLHDALREVDPMELRGRVPPMMVQLPGAVLHGPAAAERLRVDGVDDGPLLTAITYHTIGSPDLDRMGRALYAADFLEPGRSFRSKWRAELRDRMPGDLDAVVFEIVGARMKNLVERGVGVLPQTVAFWNQLTKERDDR